jgi:uncharacterized protein
LGALGETQKIAHLMRDIMPPTAAHLLKVESYGSQGFCLNGQMWEGSVLLFPDHVLLWKKADSTLWTIEDFESVFSAQPKPEVLLLGTGKAHQFVHPELRRAFKARGVSMDSMDTGAACRTYNILLAEGRHVAALLLALS